MNSPRPTRPAPNLFIALMTGLMSALMLVSATHAANPTFPPLTGRVVDDARILMPETEAEISAKLEQLEAQTSDQFVVVTLGDLQGYDIADYGHRLGRHWGIGQSETNNGVILIVAPNDRKVRLEVGYGLEPVLTDALSNQIIQNDILPPFRQGGYARGINAGVDAVITQLTLDPAEAQARAAQVEADTADAPVFPAILFLLIMGLFFFSLFRRGSSKGRRHRGGIDPVVIWGAGEVLSQISRSSSRGSGGGSYRSSGGGFRGGGGSFGGGGASGGW